MEASLRSYSDTERKYLEVSGLISNLYHKYAELASNQVDTPNFSDPFSVLEAIQELVIRFVPNKAGAAFRELGGFANRYGNNNFSKRGAAMLVVVIAVALFCITFHSNICLLFVLLLLLLLLLFFTSLPRTDAIQTLEQVLH